MILVHATPDWQLVAAVVATGLLVARIARWLLASVDVSGEWLP